MDYKRQARCKSISVNTTSCSFVSYGKAWAITEDHPMRKSEAFEQLAVKIFSLQTSRLFIDLLGCFSRNIRN